MQQKVDASYLASSQVGTPDPRQAHPPKGEQLIISWKLPQKMMKKKPFCSLHVIYWDYTEETFYHDIDYKTGYWKYTLLGEKFLERKGILTYRIEILTEDGEVYREWKHQLWVNLIQL
jgi:hypothetical protein